MAKNSQKIINSNDNYEYKNEYSDKIIAHCKNGGFIETLPSALNIPFSVLAYWSKTQQDIDDAISIGLSHTINYWINKLEVALANELVDPIKVNAYTKLIDRCFKLYDDKITVNKFGNENRSGIRINKNAGMMNLED